MDTRDNTDELMSLKELAKFVAEQKARQASNRAALEAVREKIRNQGRFVPRVEPVQPIRISF